MGRRGRRPLQREALSLRTSDRVTGVAIRFPVAALVIQGGQSRPPLRRFVSLLDKLTLAAYNLRGVPPLLR